MPAPNASRDETGSDARDEPEPDARQDTATVLPPADTAPAAQQQAAPAVQDTEPAPSVPVAAPTGGNAEPAGPGDVSATGMWAVQLGSFSNPENAERLAAELRTKGYAAFLSQLKSSSGPLHRVRIGPQKDLATARKPLPGGWRPMDTKARYCRIRHLPAACRQAAGDRAIGGGCGLESRPVSEASRQVLKYRYRCPLPTLLLPSRSPFQSSLDLRAASSRKPCPSRRC
ncbi:MAG: SPOR domain-containing protein [Woeseiaceae bacterium]|nr:SPOR domain-containing protein [Woeseiaceae bacterium]